MAIDDKGTHMEIIASEGKYLAKNGSFFKRCVMLPSETKDSYTEIPEEEVERLLKEYEND